MTTRRLRLANGFTLLEMALVAAIIAVLTALVFAAFAPARAKGRETACISNLHQWGKAFAMYIADYDGVEPVQGVRMTHAELGLPTDTIKFEKMYKFWKTPVATCPNEHLPPIDENGVRKPSSSYLFQGFSNDESFPMEISERGPEYPLVICNQHNADVRWSRQPSWAKMRVLTLRINQQVDSHVIPVHGISSYQW